MAKPLSEAPPCRYPRHRDSDWTGPDGRKRCGVCHPRAGSENGSAELDAILARDPGAEETPEPEETAPAEFERDEPVELALARGGSSGAAEKPAIVTVGEFTAIHEPGAEPLLGEPGQVVIPKGGDALLYGDGGASKTTLAIDLAVHLATGVPWLGVAVPKPVRVLLIEAEGPRPLFREKLRHKLKAWGGPDPGERLYVYEKPWASFRFQEPHSGPVADLIAEREIDLLVAGPLVRIGMDEVGTLQEVRDFSRHIEQFRQRTKRELATFKVHHESKAGRVSGAWEGAGDCLLHAQVFAHGRTNLTFQKVRWASDWHMRKVDLTWTDGEGFDLADDPDRDYRTEIVQLLSVRPHLTAKDIRKEIGGRMSAIESALENGPFKSKTGLAAKALGRHSNACLWEVGDADQ
jgi:AAA domain-containing protein